ERQRLVHRRLRRIPIEPAPDQVPGRTDPAEGATAERHAGDRDVGLTEYPSLHRRRLGTQNQVLLVASMTCLSRCRFEDTLRQEISRRFNGAIERPALREPASGGLRQADVAFAASSINAHTSRGIDASEA